MKRKRGGGSFAFFGVIFLVIFHFFFLSKTLIENAGPNPPCFGISNQHSRQ